MIVDSTTLRKGRELIEIHQDKFMSIRHEDFQYNFIIKQFEDKEIAYPFDTNPEVIHALHQCLKDKTRIRIFYGNPYTGMAETYMPTEEERVLCGVWEGYLYIGNSILHDTCKDETIEICSLRIKYIKGRYYWGNCYELNKTSYLVHSNLIVRIDYSNKKDGDVIWSHPNFHWDDEI